jgi:secreted trypsin-like serine protease
MLYYCSDNQCNFVSVRALIGHNVQLAEVDEFPYIVGIMKIPKKGPQLLKHHICTGTLISLQDVLTAEHCIFNLYPMNIQIVSGSIDLWNGKACFPLWWMTYNQWASNNNIKPEYPSNDLAILKVNVKAQILKLH